MAYIKFKGSLGEKQSRKRPEEKQWGLQNTLLWFSPTQQVTKMMMPSHHAFSLDAFHQDPLKPLVVSIWDIIRAGWGML